MPIPISLVAHTVFCPRRAWLEASGEETPSVAIDFGTAAHEAVDLRRDDRSIARRSVDVTNPQLGLTGRCDVVGQTADGLKVVEYKSAPLRRRPEVTEAQRVQLALQGMSLEAMGHRVGEYAVYFTNHRREISVHVDEGLRRDAVAYVAATRALVDSATAPEPLHDDPRCRRCSHVGICLPEERAEQRIRRAIRVSDPDGQTLHLMTPGSRASLRSGRVVVHRDAEELASVPVELVSALVIHGNVDVSSALLRETLWRGLPVVWCSMRGVVTGFARSAHSPNGAARVAQRTPTPGMALSLAREFIATKIANQATQMRRSARTSVQSQVWSMRELVRIVGRADSVAEILGREGEAASVYFSRLPDMLAATAPKGFADHWPGRTGRGALDPLNVALNYAYGLLLSQCIRALLACGLDPHAGFLHSPGRNKPAMALDLMEEFRPPLGDAVVVSAVNNGELTPQMFSSVLGGARLRDEGRRTIARCFERRLDHSITHPVFGYPASWRRTVEIQARMVLGVLDGTQDRYVGVRLK